MSRSIPKMLDIVQKNSILSWEFNNKMFHIFIASPEPVLFWEYEKQSGEKVNLNKVNKVTMLNKKSYYIIFSTILYPHANSSFIMNILYILHYMHKSLFAETF